MLILVPLKTQENVAAKWTGKQEEAHQMRSSCISRPELKQNEEKVSLFNVLPPRMDLLVPPPAEAP